MEAAIRTLDAKSLVASMVNYLPSEAAASSSSSFNDGIVTEHGEMGTEKLTKLKLLLTQSITEIGRLMAQTAKDDVVKAAGSAGGKNYLVINDAQMLEPRGRFNVTLSSEGMLLEGKQVTCFVPWGKISHTACVPSNASSKKEGEELLTLLLSEPVKCNNKDIKTLVWNLSKASGKDLSAIHESSSAPITGTEHTVVAALVGLCTNMIVVTPQKELFQSITAQKPFLRCYKGIQEGAIYPLQNGILFVKPALFITTENIASLSAGRGGGAGNTRYVDLVIETADGKSHEFTNIERDELPAIQVYVKGYLEARKKQEEKEKSRKQQAKSLLADAMKVDGVKVEGAEDDNEDEEEEEEGEEGDDDEDDSDDDDDFDPDASDDEGSDFRSEGSNDGSDDDDDDGGSDSDLEEAKGAAKKKAKASKQGHGPDASTAPSSEKGQPPQPRAKRAAAAAAEKKVAEELKAAEIAASAANANAAASGANASSSASVAVPKAAVKEEEKPEVKMEVVEKVKEEVQEEVVDMKVSDASSSHKRSHTAMEEEGKQEESQSQGTAVGVEPPSRQKESHDDVSNDSNGDIKRENAEPNHLQRGVGVEGKGGQSHGNDDGVSPKRVKVEGNESSSSSSTAAAGGVSE